MDLGVPTCWIDGKLLAPDARGTKALGPTLLPGCGAPLDATGCYTTARIVAGQARWSRRHAARLRRDARAGAIGDLDGALVEQALDELGRAAFAGGDGVVKVEARRCARGELHVVALSRALGPEPSSWRAEIAKQRHPGPGKWPGAKQIDPAFLVTARAALTTSGLEEALLLDSSGHLIEGTRSNLLAVDGSGQLCTPDLARGAVRGLALSILLERVPDLVQRDIHHDELATLHEIVAVNSVRGVCPIRSVDGQLIGDAGPGTGACALREALEGV